MAKGWNEVVWNEVVMERSNRIPTPGLPGGGGGNRARAQGTKW